MLIKKNLLLATTLMFALPAFADITVINKTDYSGTGYINSSPCSSKVSGGVHHPHDTLTVPQSVITTFCMIGRCTAHVYTNENCSGKEIATADIDKKNGSVKSMIYDKERFDIENKGKTVIINPKHPKGILERFFRSIS